MTNFGTFISQGAHVGIKTNKRKEKHPQNILPKRRRLNQDAGISSKRFQPSGNSAALQKNSNAKPQPEVNNLDYRNQKRAQTSKNLQNAPKEKIAAKLNIKVEEAKVKLVVSYNLSLRSFIMVKSSKIRELKSEIAKQTGKPCDGILFLRDVDKNYSMCNDSDQLTAGFYFCVSSQLVSCL